MDYHFIFVILVGLSHFNRESQDNGGGKEPLFHSCTKRLIQEKTDYVHLHQPFRRACRKKVRYLNHYLFYLS